MEQITVSSLYSLIVIFYFGGFFYYTIKYFISLYKDIHRNNSLRIINKLIYTTVYGVEYMFKSILSIFITLPIGLCIVWILDGLNLITELGSGMYIGIIELVIAYYILPVAIIMIFIYFGVVYVMLYGHNPLNYTVGERFRIKVSRNSKGLVPQDLSNNEIDVKLETSDTQENKSE